MKLALDNKNKQAVINTRIVFDHAGRQNAFKTQYVALRGIQLSQLWFNTWIEQQQQQQRMESAAAAVTLSEGDTVGNINVPTAVTTTSTTTTGGGTAGEFAAEGSDVGLRVFYDALTTLVIDETDWLHDVFPYVKSMLLPAFLCDSLASLKEPIPRANVFLHPSVTDAVGAVDAIAYRLFSVGEISVTAAARVATALMPSHEEGGGGGGNLLNKDEKTSELLTSEENGNGNRLQKSIIENEKDYEKDLTIIDAISSLLMPYRMFWDSVLQVAVRQGRTRADAIQMTLSKNNVG